MLNSLIIPETDLRKIVLRLPDHLPTTNKHHIEIFRAIENRNPTAAKKAMIVALSEPLKVIQKYVQDKESVK
jgi:DNA-binding GntR family transcriptional regulator